MTSSTFRSAGVPRRSVEPVASVLALRVVVGQLARDRREPLDLARAQPRAASRGPRARPRGCAVVEDRPEDRERAVRVVDEVEQTRLLRPVGVRCRDDLPEAAAAARACAAIRLRCWCPATNATTPRCRRSRHSTGSGHCAARAAAEMHVGSGVRHAHDRVVPEDDDHLAPRLGRRQLGVEPEELRPVDVPLVAAVRHRVEHDEADARLRRERVVPDARVARRQVRSRGRSGARASGSAPAGTPRATAACAARRAAPASTCRA